MKRNSSIMVVILILMAGCGGCRKSNTSNDDSNSVSSKDTFIEVMPRDTFITVDVSKQYPKKELILQDIMDVEYIALESSDEFVCQGIVLYIGKEIMLVRNRIEDGIIFIFDRNGKGLRKFNRRGQGPEEYLEYYWSFLDEDNGEIYVNQIMRPINVYDLHGKFLRKIDNDEGWNRIFSFDSKCLIARERTDLFDNIPSNNQRFALLSKQDGSVVKDFRIYYEKKVEPLIKNSSGNAGAGAPILPVISYRDSWLLMEPSSDTIYRVTPDYNMTPFMARTPPIQSMKTGILLNPSIFTDDYYFLETVKLEYDLIRWEGFPTTNLAYDRIGNAIFEYTVYNDDFREKGPVNLAWQRTTNSEIAFFQLFEAHDLLEANEKGHLKGKLKEITAELNEDSNPVIMIVKYMSGGRRLPTP